MRDRDPSNGRPAPPGEISPWALAGLGVEFAVALVLFGYAGQWVDRRFGVAPVGVLSGVLFGAGGTFYLSYRRLMAPRASGPTVPPAADADRNPLDTERR
ncbi:MAG: AtpZ/AtpI family protein [Gemmatimonadaceae bacterium]|jgi:hypothetical protein|nr:AtpZ/AtpI family protein [Gemmatimonadaceae bacterium]